LDFPDATIRRLEKFLSADEIRRAGAFRFASDRAHFIAGRGLLRILLGRYLRLRPQAIRFSTGKFGKPGLEAGHPSGITFSVSHAQTLALYALAVDRRVGVDVEAIRPVDEAEDILRRFFPAFDREDFARLSSGERGLHFLELWTRREAYLKGRGDGLSGLEATAADGVPAAGWQLLSFQPDREHVAALAGEGEIKKLTAWKMPGGWAQAAGPGRSG
jgi:4'-phosphopantetheinyl transferase